MPVPYNYMNHFIVKILRNKLIRFILVSGINTAFGYGLFALLIYWGISYPFALFIGTVAGILFNFKTTGVLVFKNGSNKLIFKFFGVYGITFSCNLVTLALLKQLGINVYIGGFILLFPVGLLAFWLNRKFVFNSTAVITVNNDINIQ